MKTRFIAMLLVVSLIFCGTTINAIADSCPRGGPHYGSAEMLDTIKMESEGTHMHLAAYINGKPVYELCYKTAVYRLERTYCVKCRNEISKKWIFSSIWHSV